MIAAHPWPLVLPLVVLVAAPVAALDAWGLPDLREQDKQQHAAAGLAIGAGAATAAAVIAPRSAWWTRALIGVATAAVAGAAKEAIDSCTHDADPKDALATVAGGAAGALVVTLVWRF